MALPTPDVLSEDVGFAFVFSPWHSPSKLGFVFLCHDSA